MSHWSSHRGQLDERLFEEILILSTLAVTKVGGWSTWPGYARYKVGG